MVKWEVLGPEEFLFGTGTGQCRHKTDVLKRTRWQVVLHSRYLVFKALGLAGPPSNRVPPLPQMDQVKAGWSGLVGPWCTCSQISQGFEELLHLLLEESVSVLCILMCPLRVPESDLQHLELLLLLVQLLLKSVYLVLVFTTGLLQP